jgi:hypothetical protein
VKGRRLGTQRRRQAPELVDRFTAGNKSPARYRHASALSVGIAPAHLNLVVDARPEWLCQKAKTTIVSIRPGRLRTALLQT